MARNALKNIIQLINNTLDETEPEKAFLQDLKRSIEMTDKKNFRKGSASYKPSSMGCMRQMYYVRTGTDPDTTDSSFQLIGICNNGTDTHVRIQTYVSLMRENGMDCDYIDVAKFVECRELDDIEIVSRSGMETKLFHKSLHLSFLCDGIIKYQGVYYILELKTEGSNKFWSRDGVDPNHYNQATCYSIALGLDSVIFVYINRDSYDMKAFELKVTDEMKNNVVGTILNCEDFVSMGKVPPKPEIPNKKACMYCNFKDKCNKEV